MLTNTRKMKTDTKVRGRSLVGPRGALERELCRASQKGEAGTVVRRSRGKAEEERV